MTANDIRRGHRPNPKLDRYTDRAWSCLLLAEEEARLRGHSYIGTEHLLLGIVREGEGIAAGVLEALGVDLAKARIAVDFIIGKPNR